MQANAVSNRQSIEQRILATKTMTENLERDLYDLYESLNTASPMMSTLPIETITEIFICATESQQYLGMRPSLPIPLLIGSVCRTWRKIAWSTPSLWRKIHISFSRKYIDSQAELVKEWVERSANQHLDLCLRGGDFKGWGPSTEQLSPLINASTRWKRLELRDAAFINLREDLSRFQCKMPVLSYLNLDMQWPHQDSSVVWNFESSPQLQTVHLLGPPSHCVRLDWSHIRHLTASFNIQESLSILNSLESCVLYLYELEAEGQNLATFTPSMHPHCLTHLSKLEISLPDGQLVGLPTLFRSIETPALKNFTFEFNDLTIDLGPVVDMVKRSRCSITYLAFNYPGNAEDEILDALRHFGSVQQFQLLCSEDQCPLSDLTMSFLDPEALAVGHSITECLPTLNNLTYHGHISFKPQNMITMLKNRMSHSDIGTLERFTISYRDSSWAQDEDPNVMRDFHRELATLCLAGTDVDITWDEDI